jgi:ribose 5-phosphate isomerase
MTTRTITISEDSLTRIVEVLNIAKNDVESDLNEEGIVVEDNGVVIADTDINLDDWRGEISDLRKLRKALQEIGG